MRNIRISLVSPAFRERAPSKYREETDVYCQKPNYCLTGWVRTFVEACLDWNRVPVRAKVLSAELEERASIDMVWGRTGRRRNILMGGFPSDPFGLIPTRNVAWVGTA